MIHVKYARRYKLGVQCIPGQTLLNYVLLIVIKIICSSLVSESLAVDGRNPANQLRLVVYSRPIIYTVLYIPGGAGFLNHQKISLVSPVSSFHLKW